jgi:2-polyprenyl-3-methyl-5-hydroxy-6-metoxy-1,4-benzoquinol methylase
VLHEKNPIFYFSDDFQKYHKVVLGSERSRHTYMRRLNTIEKLSDGIRGKRVLDMGCGYGFRTVGIAKKGAHHVIGIDEDNIRIREGQLFAKENQIGNIEFAVMDAGHTEFDDESFDVIIADEMIHHVDNLPGLIKEMHRILKGGGVTIISDHNRLSIPSELIRTIYFKKEKERVFTAEEIRHLLISMQFKDIRYNHIIMTMPFHNMSRFLMQINYAIEYVIERIPVFQLQCGLYVIRGKK